MTRTTSEPLLESGERHQGKCHRGSDGLLSLEGEAEACQGPLGVQRKAVPPRGSNVGQDILQRRGKENLGNQNQELCVAARCQGLVGVATPVGQLLAAWEGLGLGTGHSYLPIGMQREPELLETYRTDPFSVNSSVN